MKRSKVTAAAVSGLSLVVVVVVAVGLNLGVLRAGRASVKAVSVAAAPPSTEVLPTVVTVYVDDQVPIVIPATVPPGASTEPAPGDTAAAPTSAPPTESTGEAPATVDTSTADGGPPTATSVAAAPPASSAVTTPPPTQPAPTAAPTTTPTTRGTTTTTRPPSTTAPATVTVFDLPRQAGTADIAVGSSSLALQSVQLAGGWRYSCESPQGREIQLKMSGPAGSYEFTIKLESGQVLTEGG